MPETATRPTARAASEDQPVGGASAMVEAATAEAAIAEVHARYGSGARIVEARRVLRGGIGGFFAKEHVQLHVDAQPRGHEAPSPATPVTDRDDVAARAVALAAELTAGLGEADTPPTRATPGTTPDTTFPARPPTAPTGPVGGPSPVDRLLGGATGSDRAPTDARDQLDFGTYLRQQLAADRAAALPHETDVGLEPSTPPASTEGAGGTRATEGQVPSAPMTVEEVGSERDQGPAWSTTRLLHLGLPATLVHGLEVEGSADDLAWLGAVTDAVRPLCRPLPAGDAVLVGPGAPALSEEIGAPAARSRTWLAALGSGRWRHLVLGGEQWRDELATEPLAVSWTSPQELPDALRCAIELGLVLGYGPQGGAVRRARPLDVALAVRALVDGR